MPNGLSGRSMKIEASFVQIGDVYTDSSGTDWMVRDADETSDGVKLRLSAGRTDPGDWEHFARDEVLDIYRRSA